MYAIFGIHSGIEMIATTPPLPVVPREVQSMLELYTDPAILVSPDYYILAANQAYKHLYGDDTPLRHRRCYEVSHRYTVPCDQAGETCPLSFSQNSGESSRVLHLHHTPRGEEHVDVETRPVRNDKGKVVYFLEIMRQTRVASASLNQQGLIGRSAAFNRMLELVQRVAPSGTSVLLLGESGTGKELVAKAIHNASQRRKGAFVPLECSGLSESLFESELFGHEKGAFTGAHTRKTGLVEAARGGTLFLDEVGDIPLSIQVKLLRLLETGTYRRVGSVELEEADFRLICATHQDLDKLIDEAQFRRDLYYRINTFPIRLPALRDRLEDLPLLAETFLRRLAPKRKLTLDPQALACLERYAFPGNIRELRNILERASLFADEGTILPEHMVAECRCDQPAQLNAKPLSGVVPLKEVERRYLAQVTQQYQGDRRDLARELGLSERTFYRKLQQLKHDGVISDEG
jgi:two-component system response regulator HydG